MLDDCQHLQHLLWRNLDTLGEGEVVGYKVGTAAHIARTVDAAYYFLRYGTLAVVQVL